MRLTKKISTVMLVLVASFSGISSAWAHVDVSATTPYDGQVLATSPASIDIAFEGLVDPTQVFSTLRKADGTKLDAPKRSTPDGPTSKVDFTLPALADGTYVAGYRANSSDGHTVEGEFSFSVGAAPASKLVIKAKQPLTGRTLEVLGRNTFDLGIILLVGSIFWMLILFPKTPKPPKKESVKPLPVNPLLYEKDFETKNYYYKVLNSIALLAVTLLSTGLFIRIGSFLAQSIPGASNKQRWELITAKPLIKLILALVIVYIINLLMNSSKISQEKKPSILAILGFISLYTIGLVSHAADQPLPLMDAGLWACHVTLVSLWVGPVIVYAIIKFIPNSKFSKDDLLNGLKQFAPLAIFSALFASVTGAAQAWVYAGGALPKGEYLYLILAKIALIIILLPFGLLNNRRIAKNKSEFTKSYRYELVLMFLVIMVAGILATTSPLSN